MRISDWSSDVCSSDLDHVIARTPPASYIGLPGAALPSSVRRGSLPSNSSESCAGEKRWRSPELRNRYLPSGEKAMRAPDWPPGDRKGKHLNSIHQCATLMHTFA